MKSHFGSVMNKNWHIDEFHDIQSPSHSRAFLAALRRKTEIQQHSSFKELWALSKKTTHNKEVQFHLSLTQKACNLVLVPDK